MHWRRRRWTWGRRGGRGLADGRGRPSRRPTGRGGRRGRGGRGTPRRRSRRWPGRPEHRRRVARAAWACAAWEPAKVSSVTLTAATTHTATAAAAIAAPGWARMLAQLTCLIARENLANHVDSARRATRRRYATASSAGGGSSGSRPAPAVPGGAGPAAAGGKTPPGAARPARDWAQVWHSSMCQPTRSRVCSVSCPSQSASNSPSTGQASRLVSAICSAPRASSSRLRARAGQGVRPAP